MMNKLRIIAVFSFCYMLLACNRQQQDKSKIGAWEPEVKKRMLAHCIDQASIGLESRDSTKIAANERYKDVPSKLKL